MTLTPGQRVRHWRELRGLSQAELARRAKLPNYKLCKIEGDEQEVRAKELEEIAIALDLTMAEFYGGEPS